MKWAGGKLLLQAEAARWRSMLTVTILTMAILAHTVSSGSSGGAALYTAVAAVAATPSTTTIGVLGAVAAWRPTTSTTISGQLAWIQMPKWLQPGGVRGCNLDARTLGL